MSAGLVFLVDQFTKALVVRHLAEGQSVQVGWFIRIRHVANRRGTPRVLNSAVLLCLWGSALGSLILVMEYGTFFQSPAAQAGLGAGLGGAASNLYDRLRRGVVIDFLRLGRGPCSTSRMLPSPSGRLRPSASFASRSCRFGGHIRTAI
jgi:lipoprotein signal peptidase